MGPRDPERSVRIAALQAGATRCADANPGLEANSALLADLARAAAEAKPDLIVFPEYAISGWPYPPEEVMRALAEVVPGHGPWYTRYARLAAEIHSPVMAWLVESAGGRLYNTAFLLDARGRFVGKYRKVHANLGEQTWWGWSQGEAFAPIEHNGVRYGISICADMWFPETVRCQELMGADVIVHMSIADDMGHILPVRALDSEIPIVAAIFQGGTYAVGPRGELLDKLAPDAPGWRTFELHPFRTRTARKYGGLWVPKLGHRNLRNVRAYDVLVEPATRPPWTEVFLDAEGRAQTREQLLDRFGGRYDSLDAGLYTEPAVSFAEPWTSPYVVDPHHPYHLVNRQGRHLFIVNKTAWAYLSCRDPAAVAARARSQGANVLRVALEGQPYLQDLGIDLWPWRGTRRAPAWDAFDEGYWDQMEARVRIAGEHGLGLDIVLYFTLHPTADDVDAQRPYWEQALRRLSKYANVLTWEIANEFLENGAFQDAAGSYLSTRDPYRRPVCTSDGTTDDAAWPDKPWVDLAINHSCTSSGHDLGAWYLAVARNTRAHGKPAWCNESGRERRHGNDDGVHRRKQGWLWCGAGGFWSWHAWDGCEGIDDLEYTAPGEQWLEPMARYFSSVPFWRLDPTYTALQIPLDLLVSTSLTDPERALVIGYVCTPDSGGTVVGGEARLRVPDGLYRCTCLRPTDLSVIDERTVRSLGLQHEITLRLPPFVDDVVIQIEREAQYERTAMPRTH